MKTLLLSTCFFFVSICLFSQAVAVSETGAAPAVKTVSTPTAAISTATVAAHNKMAFTQIGEHLQKHLTYPAEMTELALEGTVTAAVVISPKGKIARITIAKADLPEAFHQELLRTLNLFEKLELKAGKYLGETVLYLPVRFSL